ncbi:hypothetical protein [Mycobacteroides abscessus]|uniref:hypothetical protein n=1 Tax=Mycobacteroides abscessus TaxID=36809 RepID=UPI001F39099F|nr:hypothetical protein [Mycobacteroides abscessus]
MPDTPGVKPVDAGTLGAGVLGAVGSWWAVAELTAVVIVAAAAGRSGTGMDGILGRPVGLICWCCSDGWWACAAFPAGVPDEESLDDLTLGAVGAPDGPLPATSPARVEFVMCGLTVELGALGALGDSAPDGAVVRGISGSWCGSGTGAPGAPV